jgi:hypothetical protein
MMIVALYSLSTDLGPLLLITEENSFNRKFQHLPLLNMQGLSPFPRIRQATRRTNCRFRLGGTRDYALVWATVHFGLVSLDAPDVLFPSYSRVFVPEKQAASAGKFCCPNPEYKPLHLREGRQIIMLHWVQQNWKLEQSKNLDTLKCDVIMMTNEHSAKG